MSINKVIISGNLGRDPELKSTRNGKAVLQMLVAVEEVRRGQNGFEKNTSWVTCIAFDKRAEGLANSLRKGTKVCVEGRLHENKWQDKDGNNRSRLEVWIDEIEFMSPKEQTQSNDVYYEDVPF